MRFDKRFFIQAVPQATVVSSKTALDEPWNVVLDAAHAGKGDLVFSLCADSEGDSVEITELIARGIAGFVVPERQRALVEKLSTAQRKQLFIVVVPQVRDALIALASAWRQQFSIPIIGITGSVGKTSTKEILSNIFSCAEQRFMATRDNENDFIGVACNLLRIRDTHQFAVIEMGISHRGEMQKLAELVRPTTAIITSIGHSHMEGLGSLADIAQEKRDIFSKFSPENIGIINGDQQILSQIAYPHPVVRFGYKTTNQVQARKVQANSVSTFFVLKLYGERYTVKLRTNHAGQLHNALAAAAAAFLADIPVEHIVAGIEMPVVIPGRFQPTKLKKAKGVLIDDCYNASPESMKAALLAFEKVESKGQKIAVLGDMDELGVSSAFWHRQLGRFLRKVPSLNHLVLVGDLVKWTKDTVPVGLSYEHVTDWKSAVSLLKKRLDREAVILVKASLPMLFSNIVEELAE